MKSIERKFNRIQVDNPNLSSFTCFVKTIKKQNYHIDSISIWFDELVDKGDYRRGKEKEEILLWLKTV